MYAPVTLVECAQLRRSLGQADRKRAAPEIGMPKSKPARESSVSACGVRTHAVVRAAAAKPGSAWIQDLVGGARPAHSLCIMSIASDTLHEQLPVPLTLNTTGEYYTGMTES